LAPAAAAGLSPETIASAQQWLTGHGWAQGNRFAALPPAVVAQWALAAGAAALATTEGRTGDGLASLRRAYDLSDHPDLKAIADVLATRIGQRLSPPHTPVQREHAARSVFELALEARRTAAYAIQSDSNRWPLQVKELRALLPELAAAGSLTTQAYVHNALALLLRRLGQFQEALVHAAEAAPLAVFSGDLTLMQAVFFNFGNIASDLRRQDPAAVPEGLAIALIEADRAIRRRLGLGMDSAQGELLLAYLAYEEGALTKAQGWLDEAAAIMAVSQVPADAALAARVGGLVRLARGDRGGIDDLERAIRLFDRIGNTAAATHVRGELAAARAG
jgi:tetratricopeptide (TPR) repeat protein